jgi:hypothetical protein
MRLQEVTASNKPYIRVTKGKKKVDIPISPKVVLLPPSKGYLRNYALLGCESIRFHFKGKTVKLNWAFNHNKMTLYCTSGRKAYSWNNIKVATVTGARGKKEHIVVCKRAYGDETERRRFIRYPVVKEVTIIQGDNKFPATTVDISYGGMGLKCTHAISLIPTQPIKVDFGDTKVSIRLVRTIFNGDGSEFFGCSVSSVFRQDMAKILHINNSPLDIELASEAVKKKPKKREDPAWNADAFKRWHQ